VTLLVNSPHPRYHALGAGFIEGIDWFLASFDCRLQRRLSERFCINQQSLMWPGARVGRQTRQDDDLPAMRRRPVSYAGAACSNGACATASGGASWPRCSCRIHLGPLWPRSALRGFWAPTRMPAGSVPTHAFSPPTGRARTTMAEERRLHRVPRPPPPSRMTGRTSTAG
jgi:hypothetical protein